jgi:hypothetical protein
LEISSRFLLGLLLSFSFWVLVDFLCLVDLLSGRSKLEACPVNAPSEIGALENRVGSCFTKIL